MNAKFRVCDDCAADGKEERIGTSDAPIVELGIGLMVDGLSTDAVLPRWAWQIWTRLNVQSIDPADGQPGVLVPLPRRHELCAECASSRLSVVGAHDVITQREYRDECRKAMAVVSEVAAEAD